ncbi:MAG: porin family protein [Tannerella sp.]|jgi:hypothetical protein|nr:porin family protein [Tannerella sp.]
MKKVVFILALILFTGVSLVNAQDIITLREDGREIRAIVTEVGDRDVKYKPYDNRGRQVYSLPKSKIFMIEYEDGSKDVFNTRQTASRRRTNDYYYDDDDNGYDYSYGTQESEFARKGYAGITIGGSALLEDYSNLEKNGIQFNFNFGYLFGRHIGITSSFFYTSYDLKNQDASLGLTGFLVGPLISFPSASQKVSFDLRPTIGFASLHAQMDGESETDGSAVAVDLGGSVRWNVSSVISLSANLDYLYHSEFEEKEYKYADLKSVGLTFGVNFRF